MDIVLNIIAVLTGVSGLVLAVIAIISQIRQAKVNRLQEAQLKQQEARLEHKDRLMFLVQVILDRNIPVKSRQPFYDEYIQTGGNSTVVKFWLEETQSLLDKAVDQG